MAGCSFLALLTGVSGSLKNRIFLSVPLKPLRWKPCPLTGTPAGFPSSAFLIPGLKNYLLFWFIQIFLASYRWSP
jgi:hypothetical protein